MFFNSVFRKLPSAKTAWFVRSFENKTCVILASVLLITDKLHVEQCIESKFQISHNQYRSFQSVPKFSISSLVFHQYLSFQSVPKFSIST